MMPTQNIINTLQLIKIIFQHKILILPYTPLSITKKQVSSPRYVLRSDSTYFFVYYSYKSKLYFLPNARTMIFCSLVKIITTHTHTFTRAHTHIPESVAT